MNQNYNSLLSPKRHPSTTNIHFNPSKEVHKSGTTNINPSKQEERVVSLNRENVMKEIQLFSWRYKTSLPILKVNQYQIYPLIHPFPQNPIFQTHPTNIQSPSQSKQDNHLNEKISSYVRTHQEVSFYELRIKTEQVRSTLQDIDMLPIPQIIYLLKETLIGFEVLIDIFGLFTPKKKMVVLNYKHQWKVWINQQYALSTKSTQPISEKDFILTLLTLIEQHSTPNTQSKNLFHLLKTHTMQQHQSTFLNILQKINEFVAHNKIFNVTKVILSNERQTSNGETLKNIKQDLQKIITPTNLQRKHIYKPPIGFGNNRSTTNLMDRCQPTSVLSPVSKPQNPFKPNNTVNYNVFSPTSPNTHMHNDKSSQFNKFCDNWEKPNPNNMNVSKVMTTKTIPPPIDYSQIVYHHPTATNFQQRPNFNISKHNKNPSVPSSPLAQMKKTTFATTTPTKNRKQIKQMVNQRPKPVSRLEQSPQKRNTRRKYSQDIVLVKSLQRLTSKQKCGNISTIYNPNQIKFFNKVHEPIMIATPSPTTKTITKNSSQSPQVKGMSSPNNSSSTKQIQQSGEIKSNYIKLKMKDLGGEKPTKNNQSVINSYHINPIDKKDKNMAVSYQFESKDCNKSSDSEHSLKKANKKQAKWENKISGLFSDNVSIKHLKESIKIKSKEQDYFEKEYLKDVKLDLLQKFGRKANHIVEQDDFKFNNANYYKSMQLIEQQIEQGKSYFDEQQKMDDFPRQQKNKRLTVQPKNLNESDQLEFKQCNSEQFDDNDIDSQICSDDGFNFQTEMYVINPSQ